MKNKIILTISTAIVCFILSIYPFFLSLAAATWYFFIPFIFFLLLAVILRKPLFLLPSILISEFVLVVAISIFIKSGITFDKIFICCVDISALITLAAVVLYFGIAYKKTEKLERKA